MADSPRPFNFRTLRDRNPGPPPPVFLDRFAYPPGGLWGNGLWGDPFTGQGDPVVSATGVTGGTAFDGATTDAVPWDYTAPYVATIKFRIDATAGGGNDGHFKVDSNDDAFIGGAEFIVRSTGTLNQLEFTLYGDTQTAGCSWGVSHTLVVTRSGGIVGTYTSTLDGLPFMSGSNDTTGATGPVHIVLDFQKTGTGRGYLQLLQIDQPG